MMLLGASYYFYSFWNPQFIFLLLFSTALDFYLGIKIFEARTPRAKKFLLVFSIVLNLGVLGFFKYFNFLVANLYGLSHWMAGTVGSAPHINVILPIGISFYTFISLSYTIDVYRGHCEPHRNFFAYAGFVSFFPHLIAGPLIRHDELVFQLEDPKRAKINWGNFCTGVQFFILGLSKKILVADRLASGVNPALVQLSQLSSLEALLVALGYTFQLYFDFSAYSDMAVGLAKMMNIEFPKNFDSPYKAKSITEFWQRWHISLSRWLRDYLYIPLGGNRGSELATYRNLFLTMLIGGLWHGASWVFVIWGAYHGVLLALERATKNWPFSLPKFIKAPLTFVLVMIGWIFFRSTDLSFAVLWLSKIFTLHPTGGITHFDPGERDKFAVALVAAMIISWRSKNLFEFDASKYLKPQVAWLLALLFFTSLAFLFKKSPFLYFQF